MMGGPQMPPRPIKRGVSRAVPVVVSAGLAVGVFCGLLFGLGTGDQTASAEPAKGNNVHATSGDDTSGAAPAGIGATAAMPPPPKAGSAAPATGSATGSANPVATATGSAAPASGSGAGSGSAAAKTGDIAKLTIEVEPAAAASVAKIQIDGKDITGTSIDLPADKKSVKVSVTATGYHSVDKKVDVTGGSETKVQLELTKRSTGTSSPGFGGASTGGNHVPVAPPKKKPSNNGIIDI